MSHELNGDGDKAKDKRNEQKRERERKGNLSWRRGPRDRRTNRGAVYVHDGNICVLCR